MFYFLNEVLTEIFVGNPLVFVNHMKESWVKRRKKRKKENLFHSYYFWWQTKHLCLIILCSTFFLTHWPKWIFPAVNVKLEKSLYTIVCWRVRVIVLNDVALYLNRKKINLTSQKMWRTELSRRKPTYNCNNYRKEMRWETIDQRNND